MACINDSEHLSPPSPPPLPPPTSARKTSSLALKVRSAPPGWAYEGKAVGPTWDPLTPPPGMYFFYGTLQDPGMLAEILDLPSPPVLRPAHVVGYHLRLWGQYPALVEGEPGKIVTGSAFQVPDEAAAARLASYETANYWPRPCNVRLNEGEDQELVEGYTFIFCGNAKDLSDGEFDLGVWLRRMGRKRAAGSQNPV